MSLIPENRNLFVINIDYRIPRDEALPHLDAHMVFIRKYIELGIFLVSGPKLPLEGGVIIAMAQSMTEIEAVAAEDPLYVAGCTTHQILEFKPTSAQPGLK